MADEPSPEESPPSEERGRLRGLARRLFGDDEDDSAEVHRTRELLIAALATGDKAKTEIVRMVAREVRGYLEALDLHKDLHHLLTNYSLEVHASLSLKPLTQPREEAPGVSVKRKTEPE